MAKNIVRRYYKIIDSPKSFYFRTIEELAAFMNKEYIGSGAFAIVDIEKVSPTLTKETEVFYCDASF